MGNFINNHAGQDHARRPKAPREHRLDGNRGTKAPPEWATRLSRPPAWTASSATLRGHLPVVTRLLSLEKQPHRFPPPSPEKIAAAAVRTSFAAASSPSPLPTGDGRRCHCRRRCAGGGPVYRHQPGGWAGAAPPGTSRGPCVGLARGLGLAAAWGRGGSTGAPPL